MKKSETKGTAGKKKMGVKGISPKYRLPEFSFGGYEESSGADCFSPEGSG